jgi:hypothetical protein
LIYNSAYQITNAAAITVTVGAGAASPTSNNVNGNNGSNSVFGSLTAIGGGGGGAYQANGVSGGSGGGAGRDAVTAGGAATAGQGFQGGNGGLNPVGSGGGGGAGQPGAIGTAIGGKGGDGLAFSISGTSTTYAGGGGGASFNNNATPNSGSGGGGNGAVETSNPTATAGQANTGGGGGGDKGGAGGSGIVIVRYPGLPAATGGTITYLNGYTIHTFTTSGTFTPYLWNDVSGGGRNGTLVNGVSFVPYKNSGILVFDGTDDYVSNINNSGMLSNGTGGFSYFAWVNLQGKPSEGTIFENGLYTNGILIRYQTNLISIYAQSSLYGNFTFNPPLNTWYYLGFVRSGNTLYFYENGSTSQNISFSPSMTYASNLFIGTSQHSTNQVFNGYIPVAQIYNRTLSTTEITQNYNAQKSRFGL